MTMINENENEGRIELTEEELDSVDGGATRKTHQYYLIQKGDNLTRIAKRFGTTIKRLKEMNPQIVDPNLIYYGTKIRIK